MARRIVTGVGPDGGSRVVSDEKLGPITIGGHAAGLTWLWGANGPVRIGEGSPVPIAPFFPRESGYRVVIFTVSAGSTAEPQPLDPATEAEQQEKLPGVREVMSADTNGFHTTQTVDVDVVLSGEVWLELDDGEVHLVPGDTVVQQGTRHAWRNHGTADATVLSVLLGA